MPPARFRLKELLGDRTRYWLAEESGVSYPTLSAMFHNDAQGISMEVLGKVAKALGVEVGDLFERKRGKS